METKLEIIEEQVVLPVVIGEISLPPITIKIFIIFDPVNNKIIGVFHSKEDAQNKIEELNKTPKPRFGR